MEAATQLAIQFVRALNARDYERAYAMTSNGYRDGVSLADLQASFEALVPLDWGETEPVEVGLTMQDWPGKKPGDVGWVFVSIYGDVYSEGVTAVVGLEGDALEVRDVEWGRP